MKGSLPRLLSASLVLCALLAGSPECRAQAATRAPRGDEDPLAATLRLAGGLEGLEKESALSHLTIEHLHAGRLEEGVRAASLTDDGGVQVFMLSRTGNAFAEAGVRPDARARKSLRRIVRDVEAER